MNKVIKVGSEIAELQQQYYPAITELGRLAVQIEEVAKRQDALAKAAATDVAKVQELITAAFAAGQKAVDSAVVGNNQHLDGARYIIAQEASRDRLKVALEKTKLAVSKSHNVLDALDTKKSIKGVGKK
ncbi:MAG: hypothetical protein ABSE41_12415 [Bacteroidota bacterium]|jgi:hypothetical protein